LSVIRDKIIQIIRHNKILISNFSYLTVLQFVNIVAPLVTYPYLINLFGASVYGELIFAQSIVNYLLIIVTYGFDIIGAKYSSLYYKNKEKLEDLMMSIFVIKSSFYVVILLLLFLLYAFNIIDSDSFILITLTTWVLLYDILFPKWFFQGMEKMKVITYIGFVNKVVFVVAVFFVIQSAEDYLLVPVINLFSTIFIGLVSIYIIRNKFHIRFSLPSYLSLRFYIQDAWSIFFSNIAINLFKGSNSLLIGSFLGMKELAFYDLAEKIVSLAKTPLNILSQTVFPRISRERNKEFIKGLIKIFIPANIVLFLFLFIASPFLILALGGNEMLPSTVLLKILLVTIPILAVGNLIGIQFLVAFGYKNDFVKSISGGLVFYLCCILVLSQLDLFSSRALAISIVLTEIVTTIFLIHFARKRDFFIDK